MADLTFEPRIVRFDDFELDVGSGELRKSGGDPVLLAEQPFRILLTLIRQSGNLVARDELRRELWPEDTFVDFEHSLNAAIKRLRATLGDSATDPRFIQTIPRRGYRFIGPIETITPTSPVEPPAAVLESESVRKGPTPTPRWWLALGGLAALVIVAVVYTISQSGKTKAMPPEIRSIAVLPLRNLSNDPNQEYFADALTEELIHSLGQIGALRVPSVTSVMRFKGSDRPLSEIANQLKVDAVLESSVQREKSRLRIMTELIHSRSDTPVWTRAFEREFVDILTLQKDVARAIADEIRVRLTPEEQTRLASAARVNPEAHEAYLMGRYHLMKYIVDDVMRARAHFGRAIELDPGYAPAHAGLSQAWWQLGTLRALGLKEVEAHARAAAKKALELDDRLAEAHVAQGYLRALYDWDWKGGENSLIRAIELDPNNSNAHYYYANLLLALGRFPEAVAAVQRAEHLDSVSSMVQVLFGMILYRAGQSDEAIAHFKKAIELEPRRPSAYAFLGDVYSDLGMHADAISFIEKARDVRTFSFPGQPGFKAAIARAYARAGRESDARRILKTLKDDSFRMARAAAYACLGDKNEAFRLLFDTVENKDEASIFIKTNPDFASLHSDSRWSKLLGRMNLTDESVSR
jgi:TolB-like protein/DNA-binding winged helix-turn-helix (wHTH) protein/cytochrome c-type biogenesis protein CcmH/NrfG